MHAALTLLRPHQWYKNLPIFAALFFSQQFFNGDAFLQVLIGFFLLCAISSAGYCINDVIDAAADKHHTEKKNRPVARGIISKMHAALLGVLLYIIGLGAAYILDSTFFIVALVLAVLSLCYTFFLKHIVFLDILTIATLFVLRALAGVYLIHVPLSAWFLLEIFFLAVFLVVARRRSDASLLKASSRLHKPVLAQYTQEVTSVLLNLSLAALVFFYCLYAHFAAKELLYILLPVFLFILLRFYFLTLQGHALVRAPERFFSNGDTQIAVASLVFVIGVVVVYYV